MSIAFVAPYQDLLAMATRLVADRGYPIRVYLGDMEEGCAAARKALEDGARIIISRGGTALSIRQTLGIDVLEVRPSVYSAMACIHENISPADRIAVVGFGPLIDVCRPVCEILRREYAAFELTDAESSSAIMTRVADWRPDVIIGDVLSGRLARERNLPFHLIESSRETLIEAFEQAMVMRNNLDRHLTNARKLSAVLNCAREGALLLGGGKVEEVNQRGCELLLSGRERLLGKAFRDIFPDQEVNDALNGGISLQNALTVVRGRRFVLDLVCGSPDMEADAAVALFQRVEHIQQTETSIRSKLLDRGFHAKYSFRDILYTSRVMGSLIKSAREYSGTECNIMIQGETGTGKELFAQSIHNAGSRASGPFVAVNCAALPGNLLESELFGYAPGAFTGALRSGKTGLFEMAHNGTLFLDEITELDVFLQARLLRVLQAREIMRVGDSRVIPVDVRVIAATNRNPREEVLQGRMRADLFFRLNVLDIVVPPLRERREDIQLLFRHYLAKYGGKYGRTPRPPSSRAFEALERHGWPGNVRELENMAEKYVTLGGLSLDTLLADTHSGVSASASEPATLESAIIRHICETLCREGGNIARTASRLAVDRNTVKRWLAKDRLAPYA